MTTFLQSSKGLQLFSHFKFLCFICVPGEFKVHSFFFYFLNFKIFNSYMCSSRKNSEMKQRNVKKGHKVYLSRIYSYRESGQIGEVLLPWVSSASQLGAYRWRGGIVTGKEEYRGSCFLVFIPAPISQGEEGFFSLFSLDQKCHGVGAWWALLTCKADSTVMRAYCSTG